MIRIGFLSISESVVAKLAAGECGGGRHVASLWRHGVTPLLHATPCSEVGERDSRCLQLPSNPAWTVTVFHAVFRVAVRVPAQRVRCRVAGFRITCRVSIAGHPETRITQIPYLFGVRSSASEIGRRLAAVSTLVGHGTWHGTWAPYALA